MKRPAEIIDSTSRCSKRSRNSALCWLAHGQPNSASSATSKMNGSEKRSTGRMKSVRLMPEVNHTTISESLYQRVSTSNTEMNSVAHSRIAR